MSDGAHICWLWCVFLSAAGECVTTYKPQYTPCYAAAAGTCQQCPNRPAGEANCVGCVLLSLLHNTESSSQLVLLHGPLDWLLFALGMQPPYTGVKACCAIV